MYDCLKFQQIQNPHNRLDGLLEDFVIVSCSNLTVCSPYAFQTVTYFHKLEICNPLGTHTKKTQTWNYFIHVREHSSHFPVRLFIEDLNTLASTGIVIWWCRTPA